MARLDDLTILLTMVDKTGKAFKSIDKKMARMQKITKAITGTAKIMGKTLAAAFVAAAVKGAMFTGELIGMSRTVNETLRETQALFLSVQDVAPLTNIDNLNEAILTMKERFADARDAGAGPLFGLIEDFQGFDIDLGVDNARLQLANFLEQVSQLDDANAKIFALKDVLGDEDARPFLSMINDTEKLNGLLVNLRTNIEDLPNVMSASDAQNVKDTKVEISNLNIAWQNFSNVVYQLVAPALGAIVKLFTWALNKAAILTEKIKEMFNIGQDTTADILGFDDPTTSAGQEEQLNVIQKRIDAVQELAKENEKLKELNEQTVNIRGAQQAESTKLANDEKRIAQEMNDLLQRRIELEAMVFDGNVGGDAPVITIPTLTTIPENASGNAATQSTKAGFESGGDDIEAAVRADIEAVKAAEDAMEQTRLDKMADDAKFKADLRAQEVGQIGQITDALGAAGSAFGAFADAAGSSAKKAFKTFQTLQIGLSTAAGISAQIQALAAIDAPTLAQKFTAYAKMGAIVATGIASLKSLTLGGGGASGGGAPSAPAASAQTTARGGTLQQETPRTGKTIIQLEGRDRSYDQTDIENLVDAFKQSGADIEVLYNS